MTLAYANRVPDPAVEKEEVEYTESHDEVQSVVAEIEHRAGPRSLVVLAIVSEDAQPETWRVCGDYSPGSVYIETEHTFDNRVRTLAGNLGARNSLALIVSPLISSLEISIPVQFHRLEVVACAKKRCFLSSNSEHSVKELVLEEESSFCGVPLSRWNTRSSYLEHEFVTGPGVALELLDDGVFDGEPQPPPFQFEKEGDVDNAADYIESEINRNPSESPPEASSKTLPWFAGLGGLAAGVGTMGAMIISSVKITTRGLAVAAGPYAARYASTTVTAGAVAGASVAATGVAAGAGVAAAVYFIPWGKLGSWLVDSFDHFLVFLRSIWNKIEDGIHFLKKVLSAILLALRGVMSSLSSRLLGSRNVGPIHMS